MIPNEYIVKNFPPHDKTETKEQGKRMDSAGARDIKSANDFLTRVSEVAPVVGNQIGFETEKESPSKS